MKRGGRTCGHQCQLHAPLQCHVVLKNRLAFIGVRQKQVPRFLELHVTVIIDVTVFFTTFEAEVSAKIEPGGARSGALHTTRATPPAGTDSVRFCMKRAEYTHISIFS